MSKLTTKNVKVSGGGANQSKTLSPGNHKCRITDISYREVTFVEGGIEMLLHLVGPDIPGFEGFLIDYNNPELGNYNGQVGKVKASKWVYADAITKNGNEISRDEEILKLIKTICLSTDCLSWFDDQDEKHNTIQEFINKLSTDKPFADKEVYFCIAGKEYTNRNGYSAFELYLPKPSKSGIPFSDKEARVLTFNPEFHLELKVKTEVSEFGDDEIMDDVSDDFTLD